MSKEEVVSHWIKGAEADRAAAQGLFQLGHYNWSLFVWHLVIEKMLKAKIVGLDREIPITHDLVRLARGANLGLSEDNISYLKEITGFNIEARYDDYKLSFYKKADKEYTDKWVKKCEEVYLWIKKEIKIM